MPLLTKHMLTVLNTIHGTGDSVVSKPDMVSPSWSYSLLEWDSAHHPATEEEGGRNGKMMWWSSQRASSFKSRTQLSFHWAYAIPRIPPKLRSRAAAPVCTLTHRTQSSPHLSQYWILFQIHSFWQLGGSWFNAFIWLLMRLSIFPHAYKYLAFPSVNCPLPYFFGFLPFLLLTYRCSLNSLKTNHSLVLCLTSTFSQSVKAGHGIYLLLSNPYPKGVLHMPDPLITSMATWLLLAIKMWADIMCDLFKQKF